MSTRMALTSFLPVAVKQAWNFALFTGSDTHRLKLAGSHAYIANRQHIDRPFAEMLRTINPTSSICAQIITFGPVDSLSRISTDPSPSNRTSLQAIRFFP